MAVHQVVVSDVGGSLSFVPTQVTLAPGDWVWWSFLNVQAGFRPFIQFQGTDRQGPFHSVRSLGDDAVIGKGNTGQPGTYLYRPILLDPQAEVMITSGSLGQIVTEVLLGQEVDTSPEAFVTYHPQAPADEKIEVKPDRLRLNTGDTASWVVSGLAEGLIVTFHFNTPEGGTSANRTGPFASFSVVAGGGPGQMRMYGTGFMTGAGSDTPPESIPAEFSYTIKVWNAEGELVGHHDPAIDNLGPPIPG